MEERRPSEWHLDHVAAGREDFQGRRVTVTEAGDGAVRGQVADRAGGPVEDGGRPPAHRVEPPAGPGRAVEQNVAAEARRGALVDRVGCCCLATRQGPHSRRPLDRLGGTLQPLPVATDDRRPFAVSIADDTLHALTQHIRIRSFRHQCGHNTDPFLTPRLALAPA